jgi:hypothetical protein
MNIKFICAVLAVATTAVHAAAVTGTYTFTGSTGNVNAFAYNGAAVPDITVSNLTKVGVETISSSGAFGARGWTTGATHFSNTFTGGINTEDYFEFTLTAVAGMTLELTSLDFGVNRNSTGPRQFEWRSSVDHFGSAISDYTTLAGNLTEEGGVLTLADVATGFSGISLDITGDEFTGHDEITFRLYGYNSEATTGTGGLSGSLSFTAQAVPEPSAALLGAIGALGLLRRRR